MTILTIGYEGLDMDEFKSLLQNHRVQRVVDVRDVPISRKPGFSKNALSDELAKSNIDYHPMKALGCPKAIRDRYKKEKNHKRYQADFLAFLDTKQSALAELYQLSQNHRCALLCFEADVRQCHRSLLADTLQKRYGVDILHIEKEESHQKG